MKRIVMILFCLTLQFGCWANSDTTRVSSQNEIVRKSELSSSDQTIKLRVDLLEKHESWTLGMLAIFLTALSVLFFLLQWIYSKKAEDNVFKKLAEIANEDKDAFKKSLKVKAIEMELTTKYPIYIITDQYKKNENAYKIQKLLRSYGFEQVQKKSYNQAGNMKFCERSVVVFCDEPVDEKRDKTLVEQLLKDTPKLGVFGYAIHYRDDFKSIFKDKGCVSFAQFPSQVYNNLMSLLHYKRYLNKAE